MDLRQRPVVNLLAIVTSILIVALLGIVAILYLALDRSDAALDRHDLPSEKVLRAPSSRGDITALNDLRKEFHTRYGDASAQILENGIHLYGDIQETALRFTMAAAHDRPFVMAFAGYSVTVGRGNFFSQSFPFVLERVLKTPLKQILGVELIVRNGAIGGIPSFPYGWCLSHFLGEDADVVSWDYGMNEGRGAAVLESYIRQALQLPKRPKFLMLDSNEERSRVLKKYSKAGLLPDAIRVSRATDLAIPEHPPPGLKDWDQFGAPNECPGRSSWHPKKMEHELIGWMIAMHMADAVERAYNLMQEPNWKIKYGNQTYPRLVFKAPMNKPPQNEDAVTALMYGHGQNGDFEVKNIQCRTSFLPAVDDEKFLPSVVVSGLADSPQDMMQERSDELYKSGWVLDVSKVERDTKRKVERCGGLGYIDMKVALYGIPESGTLQLWLPSRNDGGQTFTLILCEANENRDKDACQLDTDVKCVVGGVEVDNVTHINGAGEYLKRKTCVSIDVPAAAQVTRLGDRQIAGHGKDDMGLLVDITVRPNVTRQKGACCVSHIIWEQH
jgi:hypothetical protein